MYTAWGYPSTLTWSSSNPCDSSWTGIQCSNGIVVGLFLGGMSLTNSLDPVIGNLTGLTTINLGKNLIQGPLPSTLSKLTDLQMLDVGGNTFTATLPPQLSALEVLIYLNVSGNLLHGALPQQFSALSNLWNCYMENNRLSGSIPPQLSTLEGLASLHLNSNLLTGQLSPSLSTIFANCGPTAFLVNDNSGLCGSYSSFPNLNITHTSLGPACPNPPCELQPMIGEFRMQRFKPMELHRTSRPRCWLKTL